MTEKQLIVAGASSLAFIALCCTFVEIVTGPTDSPPAASVQARVPVVRPVSIASSPSPLPLSAPTPVTLTMISTSITPPASTVQNADLKHLAALVNLKRAKQERPDKTQWKQAIPAAQQLLLGTCDCEQRNWLKQFITMGDHALSNSKDYYASAQLMDRLPLNDQELNLRYYSE